MARTKQTARLGKGKGGIMRTVVGTGVSRRVVSVSSASAASKAPEVNSVQQHISYDGTYDTAFYAHFFQGQRDGAARQPATSLLEPRLSYVAETPDPRTTSLKAEKTQEEESHYLGVNFASSLDGAGVRQEGGRPPLDLVIALDISGSMATDFTGSITSSGKGTSKLEVAKNCLEASLKHLRNGDCLAFVVFTGAARTVIEMTPFSPTLKNKMTRQVGSLRANGGTSISNGLAACDDILSSRDEADGRQQRVLFLTDMDAWQKGDEPAFIARVQEMASRNRFTTIVGIDVDLSRASVVATSSTPGCSYCNVLSPKDFAQRLDTEFDFLVTPIAFSVRVTVDDCWSIAAGYGSPELPQTGPPCQTVSLSSLFPSELNDDQEARAGLFVLRLLPTADGLNRVTVHIEWEDTSGICHEMTEVVSTVMDDGWASPGLRKCVPLIRYVDFVGQYVREYNSLLDDIDSIPSDIQLTPKEVELRGAMEAGRRRKLREFLAYLKEAGESFGDEREFHEEIGTIENIMREEAKPSGISRIGGNEATVLGKRAAADSTMTGRPAKRQAA